MSAPLVWGALHPALVLQEKVSDCGQIKIGACMERAPVWVTVLAEGSSIVEAGDSPTL